MKFQESEAIAPVTVDEIKAHLRIDDDSEDQLLANYAIVATSDAEMIMQREVIFRADEMALATTAEDVPMTVKQYILCAVGDMYAHRELHDTTNLSQFYKHLLDAYCLYNRGDDE